MGDAGDRVGECVGDADTPFCIQSCSKPLSYLIALDEFGEEYVHKHVGTEPSGHAFNHVALKECEGGKGEGGSSVASGIHLWDGAAASNGQVGDENGGSRGLGHELHHQCVTSVCKEVRVAVETAAFQL